MDYLAYRSAPNIFQHVHHQILPQYHISRKWHAVQDAGTLHRISRSWPRRTGLPIKRLAGWAIVEHPITKTGTAPFISLLFPHFVIQTAHLHVKANANREQSIKLGQLCRNIVPTRAEPNLFELCRVQPIFNEVKCSFADAKQVKTVKSSLSVNPQITPNPLFYRINCKQLGINHF